MKKFISFVLILCLSLALFAGCGSSTQTTESTPENTAPTHSPWDTGKEALQGKKIIFLGNSYTFWGQTVIHKGYDVLTQDKRSNDQGYFYQLCKANGIDVSVTNYTFGSHDATDIIGYGPCNANRDCQEEQHQYYLQNAYYDYVAIQLYNEREYKGDLVAHLQPIVDFFQKANPDVKFLLLVPHMAIEKEYRWIDKIDSLKAENYKICNWGSLCHDLSQHTIDVPGATQTYSRSSFVVSTDNHHENILAGYITTLMVYCAITGESAVGQPYDFCDDSTINERFDLEAFREKNYSEGAGGSNFVEIMRSEADMAGIQQLVDEYLAK